MADSKERVPMMSVSSTCRRETQELTWTVEDLKLLAGIGGHNRVAQGQMDLAKCRVTLNALGSLENYPGCQLELEVTLKMLNNQIAICRSLVDRENCPLPSVWIAFTYSTVGGAQVASCSKTEDLKFQESIHDYVIPINNIPNNVDPFVDDKGSLNLKMKIVLYLGLPAIAGVPSKEISVDYKKTAAGLAKDIESLLGDRGTADFEVKVAEGKKTSSFYCHQAIVAARSSVFRAMFENDMKEKKERLVEVKDISSEAMEHFISFLYCGRFKKEGGDEAEAAAACPSWVTLLPELVYAAEKYNVQDLKNICDVQLSRAFTNDNVVEMGRLVKRHNLATAAKEMLSFIAKNPEEVLGAIAK